MYGKISEIMQAKIEPLVVGRHVWDLGAGCLGHTRMMLEMGANKVTAIDKEAWSQGFYEMDPYAVGVEYLVQYFHETIPPASMDLALLSWPCNYKMDGLVELLERAEKIVYVGKNTDGTACGDAELFRHFLTRPILDYQCEYQNTMIIYGQAGAVDRSTPDGMILGEEYAAFALHGGYSWHDVGNRIQTFSEWVGLKPNNPKGVTIEWASKLNENS